MSEKEKATDNISEGQKNNAVPGKKGGKNPAQRLEPYETSVVPPPPPKKSE